MSTPKLNPYSFSYTEPNLETDSKPLQLAKEGKLVEAGAVAEDLDRVVGLEITLGFDEASQQVTTDLYLNFEDRPSLFVHGFMASLETVQNGSALQAYIPFDQKGHSMYGEFLAYLRPYNDD